VVGVILLGSRRMVVPLGSNIERIDVRFFLLGDLLSFLNYDYVANFQLTSDLVATLLLFVAYVPILIPTCSCH
jgi:hypothetical protein